MLVFVFLGALVLLRFVQQFGLVLDIGYDVQTLDSEVSIEGIKPFYSISVVKWLRKNLLRNLPGSAGLHCFFLVWKRGRHPALMVVDHLVLKEIPRVALWL